MQPVSPLTIFTENTATLIDNMYTNTLDSALNSNILTVYLTDHLAIHTKVTSNANNTNITRRNNNKKFRF